MTNPKPAVPDWTIDAILRADKWVADITSKNFLSRMSEISSDQILQAAAIIARHSDDKITELEIQLTGAIAINKTTDELLKISHRDLAISDKRVVELEGRLSTAIDQLNKAADIHAKLREELAVAKPSGEGADVAEIMLGLAAELQDGELHPEAVQMLIDNINELCAMAYKLTPTLDRFPKDYPDDYALDVAGDIYSAQTEDNSITIDDLPWIAALIRAKSVSTWDVEAVAKALWTLYHSETDIIDTDPRVVFFSVDEILKALTAAIEQQGEK